VDDLKGKTFLAGAAIAGLSWSFTRPIADVSTVYTNAAIAFKLFELVRTNEKGVPLSSTPSLTLIIGSGLTREVNTASIQSGLLTVTQAIVSSLLLGSTIKQFSYVWSITPVGSSPIRAAIGSGYDGRFSIAQEGYGGSTVIR